VGYILVVIAAYLLGSIPTGFLVAKARGIDIRSVGSGNIGATNVFRSLGKPAGVFVLLVDALKGWLAVVVIALIPSAMHATNYASTDQWLKICAGLAVILGHNYTCWLYFKGGKGIATSAGVLIALMPWALLVIFCVWVVVFAATRYVSLASICASTALPFANWLTTNDSTLTFIGAVMSALAVYKHKANIKRLLNGTEPRIGPRAKT
jgi:glycerol-3-phosphate acyltransferase PlsY